MKDLSSIVAKFKVQGTVEEIKPLGAGLITPRKQMLPTTFYNASTMPFFRMWKCFNPILPLSQAISVRN